MSRKPAEKSAEAAAPTVYSLARALAVANGHTDPDAYAAEVQRIHDAEAEGESE